MADKVDKPKKAKAKAKKDDKGVLAALPATRAERIGTRRASAPKTFEVSTAAEPAAAPGPAPETAKKAARKAAKLAAPGTAAKPPKAAKRVSSGAAAKRRKPVAPRTFETTQAAADAAGVDEPPAPAAEPRPRAVRGGEPGMGTSAARDEQAAERGRPGGVELVSSAVQAVGGLTHAGLKVGGRVVKRAVDRLPKP